MNTQCTNKDGTDLTPAETRTSQLAPVLPSRAQTAQEVHDETQQTADQRVRTVHRA